MGLFDNVTSALNRGMDAAERTSKSARLKLQMNDLVRERRELAAQLGASLYDAVKNDEELRRGRETLFDSIAYIDERRASIQNELEQIEAEAIAAREAADAAAAAAQVLICPNCGTRVMASHAFCTGCGTPVAQIMASAGMYEAPEVHNGPVCVACGAQLEEGDLFCVVCGAKQAPDAPEVVVAPEMSVAPEATASPDAGGE